MSLICWWLALQADKVKEMLKGAGRVESDDDEQLFFHFSFRNPCKVCLFICLSLVLPLHYMVLDIFSWAFITMMVYFSM